MKFFYFIRFIFNTFISRLADFCKKLINKVNKIKYRAKSIAYCNKYNHKYQILNDKKQPIQGWKRTEIYLRNRFGAYGRCQSCNESFFMAKKWVYLNSELFKGGFKNGTN